LLSACDTAGPEVPVGKLVHVIIDIYATYKHPKVRACVVTATDWLTFTRPGSLEMDVAEPPSIPSVRTLVVTLKTEVWGREARGLVRRVRRACLNNTRLPVFLSSFRASGLVE
jgi:hypothetical protein